MLRLKYQLIIVSILFLQPMIALSQFGITTVSIDYKFSPKSNNIQYGNTQIVSNYNSIGFDANFNLWDYTRTSLTISVGFHFDTTNPAYKKDSIQDNSYYTPSYGIGLIFGRGNRLQFPIKLSGAHHIKSKSENKTGENKSFSSFILSLSFAPRIYVADTYYIFGGIEYNNPLNYKFGNEKFSDSESFIIYKIGFGAAFNE